MTLLSNKEEKIVWKNYKRISKRNKWEKELKFLMIDSNYSREFK
jgi:hypothetical protein